MIDGGGRMSEVVSEGQVGSKRVRCRDPQDVNNFWSGQRADLSPCVVAGALQHALHGGVTGDPRRTRYMVDSRRHVAVEYRESTAAPPEKAAYRDECARRPSMALQVAASGPPAGRSVWSSLLDSEET